MGKLKALFEANTVEELIAEIDAWVASNRPGHATAADSVQATVSRFTWDTPAFRETLDALGGRHAKPFLIRLAQEVKQGRRLHNDAKLKKDFNVKSGIAFAGVIGPLNTRVKNAVGRKLVDGRWEGNHASWTMDPVPAGIVLEKWAA